MGILLICLLAT